MRLLIFSFVLLAISSCKDPFEPAIPPSLNNNLVVEGVLNAGTGPTTISLSRTSSLGSTNQIIAEQNAQVSVEGSDNSSQPLVMTSSGVYTSPQLVLSFDIDYRLKIRTTDGKEYQSDMIRPRRTPAIDSVGWKQGSAGVQLYVNTKDPAGDTRYYRWDYDETWEIRSKYYASLKYIGDSMVRTRDPGEEVAVCWKYNSSKSILLGSSARLQSDIIHEAPLVFIPTADEKLAVRYSILVREYALDKNAYEFFDLIKKNTESIGTIFDQQPSEVSGNIHCINDPGEPVIGFLTACEIKEKRIFIENSQLSFWNFSMFCPSFEVPNMPDSIWYYFNSGSAQPYDAVLVGPDTLFILGSAAGCVDCTTRNGSLGRPSYW